MRGMISRVEDSHTKRAMDPLTLAAAAVQAGDEVQAVGQGQTARLRRSRTCRRLAIQVLAPPLAQRVQGDEAVEPVSEVQEAVARPEAAHQMHTRTPLPCESLEEHAHLVDPPWFWNPF